MNLNPLRNRACAGTHTRRAICAAFVTIAWASIALAQTVARPSVAEMSLMDTEDKLLQAEARHDLEAITLGFADEAVFVHGNGTTQTKADYLKAAEADTKPGNSITTAERVVLISGDIGITHGKLYVVAGEMRLPGLYLAVYIKRAQRWQLLNWQTTPLPRNSSGK